MRKKDLLIAAVDRRSDEGLEKAWCQMVKEDYVYNKNCFKYRYGRLIIADVIRVDQKEILQISMWIHGNNGGMVDVPKYYIFVDREERKWITYGLENEKWSEAMIDNTECGWYWYARAEVYESKETTRIIQRYLQDASENGYETIREFMQKERKSKRFRKYQREIDEIDKAMKRVPQIPEGFKDWAVDDAIKERRYIYYHAGRKVDYGYCTHCKKLVSALKPRHNAEGFCICCGSKIIYKAIGKAAPVIDRGRCILFQKLKDGEGYVIRYFRIYRKIVKENYTKPEENAWEEKRIILDAWMRPSRNYVWDQYPVIKKMRWCSGGCGYGDDFGSSGRMYPYNLTEQLKESNLRYLPLEDMMVNSDCIIRRATMFFKRAEDNYRVAEYLIKCKLYTLAAEFLESDRLELGGHLNVNAGGILKCLNISRDQLRILQKLDGGIGLMRIITNANVKKVNMTEEQITMMYENCISWQFIHYMRGTTPHKMLRYIMSCKNQGEYLDYLDMRAKCDYDMTDSIILYPKDIKEAHDKMVLETNERKAETRLKEVREKFPCIQEMFEELDSKYHYEYKGYFIRPARSAEEIVMEGRTLHHCVGGDGYLSGHNTGRNIILMLRKKETPDEAWYTVEYSRESGKIKQYYAHHDTQPFKEEVSKWLDRWLKEIEKREKKVKIPIAV